MKNVCKSQSVLRVFQKTVFSLYILFLEPLFYPFDKCSLHVIRRKHLLVISIQKLLRVGHSYNKISSLQAKQESLIYFSFFFAAESDATERTLRNAKQAKHNLFISQNISLFFFTFCCISNIFLIPHIKHILCKTSSNTCNVR